MIMPFGDHWLSGLREPRAEISPTMKTPRQILTALAGSPEGIRCCVAEPLTWEYPARGTTGILKATPCPDRFAFIPDGERARVNFWWPDWSEGLQIASLGIYRS